MERGRILHEGLERAEVARLFHDDAVARVERDLCDEVERLLRTRCDEDIRRGHAEAVFLIAAGGDEFTQFRYAGRERILEELCAVTLRGACHGFAERLHGEGEWAGQAAREGDDLRILRDLQHSFDERRRECFHVFAEQLLGEGFHSGSPF